MHNVTSCSHPTNALRPRGILNGCRHRRFEEAPERSFKATLVWDEPRAAAHAFWKVQHDLDLTVRDPFGRIVVGNQRPSAYPAHDRNNNVEKVRIADAASGVYSLFVSGVAVLSPQPYAVTATADGAPECPAFCAAAPGGRVCSGHGKCVDDRRCVCKPRYYGVDCSQHADRLLPQSPVQVRRRRVRWTGAHRAQGNPPPTPRVVGVGGSLGRGTS